MTVGQTINGVTVRRVESRSVVLEIDGALQMVPLTAVSPGARIAGSSTLTLSADARGQFRAAGAVNGRPMQFMVDTVASITTLSRGDAKRIGLDYRRGTSTTASTANGVVRGWQISLDSVQVGNVIVRNVTAMVVDNDALPVALLGMTFLDRFDMQRQGATLVLRRSR